MRTYISDLMLTMDAESVEDVDAKLHAVCDFAMQHGFMIVDGNTRNTREREPVESMSLGLSTAFRNQAARVETVHFAE